MYRIETEAWMPLSCATFDTADLRMTLSIWKLVFDQLRQSRSFDIVIEYRGRIEPTLKELDGHITRLGKDDTSMLTLWAARMRSCVRMMYTLDKNIPFKGKPQWDWNEVLEAMAFLEASRTLARIALLNEGVDC